MRVVVILVLMALSPMLAASAESTVKLPDMVVLADTAEDISHTDRFYRLRSSLADATYADRDSIFDIAQRAFSDARILADVHGAIQSQRFRTMYLEAHALYEEHHAPVLPIAVSKEEIGELRGIVFANAEDWPFVEVEEPEPIAAASNAETETINWILYAPSSGERLVQAQMRRLRRQNGIRGLQRRGRQFFPAINRALQRRGVPAEMRYITAIESSLDPGAVSEAGALGLWQFMPTTGEMYGLSESDLHSVGRSTSAAARHLQRLGRMFNGDWQIVLAAYNCGSGCAQNAVRRARRRLGRTPTYWDIHRYLPGETQNYVPKFIALARLMGG